MAGAADAVGLAQVDNGDGTWSTVRTDGVVEGDTQVIGPVTWEYRGQVCIPTAPTAHSGPFWVDTPAGYRDRTAAGQILGSKLVDDQDGEWTAIDVDLDTLMTTVKAQDEAASAAAGIIIPDDARYVPGLEWQDAESYWYQPLGYTPVPCGSSPELTYHIYDDDDRWRQTSLSDRQKAAAMGDVAFPLLGPGNGCTGVFLSTGSVLTAAHCLFYQGDYSSGIEALRRNITVCSRVNAYSGADCATADSYVLAPSYDGSPADDLAIIHLPPISGDGYMYIRNGRTAY